MPFLTVEPELLSVADSDLRRTNFSIAGKNLTTTDPTMESVVPAVADEVPEVTADAHAVISGG